MNRLHKKFLGIAAILVVVSSGANAENLPVQYLTPYFTEFFDSATTYNGSPIVPGSIIEAYDPTNLMIGKWRVTTAGYYGFMNAYGDEPGTPGVHEGALSGDVVTFKVNGRNASVTGDNTFTDKAIKNVQLSAAGTVGLSLVESPIDILGLPGDTLQFYVRVRNDGDGLDFYGAHLNMSIADDGTELGWRAFEPDSVVYADPNQTVYVYFSIRVATFSADTVNNIVWSVYSHNDTTQKVNGSFNIFMTLTDIDDPDGALPNSFTVYQNYPNPFNPTTTISFYLPKAQPTSLEVYNVLGQLVSAQDFGTLPAGEHDVVYEAGHLSSGVYFYRVVTSEANKIRKMVLLK